MRCLSLGRSLSQRIPHVLGIAQIGKIRDGTDHDLVDA